ncbi:hypothetical protein L0222_12670 [bacterium]|nr:hypothetical protein [bacterium]MCI0606777.1 hypothetical protein [bacterium]
MRLTKLFVATLLAGSILVAFNAEAEIKPGIRVGAYFDPTDAFIGGEVLIDITRQWWFNPNVEYVFVDGATFLTFNFDVHYDLPTRDVYVWIGGGPAILYLDPDARRFEDETDFGVNVFAGVGFRTGSRIVPYIQPKVFLSDDSEVSLAFGVRF